MSKPGKQDKTSAAKKGEQREQPRDEQDSERAQIEIIKQLR